MCFVVCFTFILCQHYLKIEIYFMVVGQIISTYYLESFNGVIAGECESINDVPDTAVVSFPLLTHTLLTIHTNSLQIYNTNNIS